MVKASSSAGRVSVVWRLGIAALLVGFAACGGGDGGGRWRRRTRRRRASGRRRQRTCGRGRRQRRGHRWQRTRGHGRQRGRRHGRQRTCGHGRQRGRGHGRRGRRSRRARRRGRRRRGRERARRFGWRRRRRGRRDDDVWWRGSGLLRGEHVQQRRLLRGRRLHRGGSDLHGQRHLRHVHERFVSDGGHGVRRGRPGLLRHRHRHDVHGRRSAVLDDDVRGVRRHRPGVLHGQRRREQLSRRPLVPGGRRRHDLPAVRRRRPGLLPRQHVQHRPRLRQSARHGPKRLHELRRGRHGLLPGRHLPGHRDLPGGRRRWRGNMRSRVAAPGNRAALAAVVARGPAARDWCATTRRAPRPRCASRAAAWGRRAAAARPRTPAARVYRARLWLTAATPSPVSRAAPTVRTAAPATRAAPASAAPILRARAPTSA